MRLGLRRMERKAWLKRSLSLDSEDEDGAEPDRGMWHITIWALRTLAQAPLAADVHIAGMDALPAHRWACKKLM